MREVEHLHAAQLEQALANDDAFAKVHESARGQAEKVQAAQNAGDQVELLGLECDDGFVDFLQNGVRGAGRA